MLCLLISNTYCKHNLSSILNPKNIPAKIWWLHNTGQMSFPCILGSYLVPVIIFNPYTISHIN